MPRITNREFRDFLKKHKKSVKEKRTAGAGDLPCIYLIFGEELIYKTALEELLEVLVPGPAKSVNYEPMDGSSENIRSAVESLNTYSMLSGTKVVGLIDTGIFVSKQDLGKVIEKIREAYENNDLKKAAERFLNLMSLQGFTFEDLAEENRTKTLKVISRDPESWGWLDDIISYSLEKKRSVPAGQNAEKFLQNAIEKGFPKGNYLVITADIVDKRRTLFKSIEEHGMAVDCSVPKGDRRADKIIQEEALSREMDKILSRHGKTMDKAAYQALYEMTGFDLRTFSNNLEKLAVYIGERHSITAADVRAALKRTKIDPIYAFTNAVTEKKTEDALFYLQSLLESGQKPLRPEQVVVAIANQLRKLVMAKDFTSSPHGKLWYSGCDYNYFKSNVIPAIVNYDHDLIDQLSEWNDILENQLIKEKPGQSKKGKKKSKKLSTDVLVAKNPKNPYPIFLMLKKSESFTRDQLVSAFEYLHTADFQIKRSGMNKRLVLEKAIISICS